MHILKTAASWVTAITFAFLLLMGSMAVAPITILAAILGIGVVTPPIRRLAALQKLGVTSTARVAAFSTVFLIIALFGTLYSLDAKGVAERSTKADQRLKEADAKRISEKTATAAREAVDKEVPRQVAASKEYQERESKKTYVPDGVNETLSVSSKYRTVALRLQAQLQPGSVGASECDRVVREAYAMSSEQHPLYNYWKKAGDLCNVYANGKMLD